MNIDTTGLAGIAATTKPSVIGCAVRIFLLGGSSMDEERAKHATGSPHLFKTHKAEIMRFVEALEDREIVTG